MCGTGIDRNRQVYCENWEQMQIRNTQKTRNYRKLLGKFGV